VAVAASLPVELSNAIHTYEKTETPPSRSDVIVEQFVGWFGLIAVNS
jgi:hypothetical protein